MNPHSGSAAASLVLSLCTYTSTDRSWPRSGAPHTVSYSSSRGTIRPSRRASAASSSSSRTDSVSVRPRARARCSEGRISSSPAVRTSTCSRICIEANLACVTAAVGEEVVNTPAAAARRGYVAVVRSRRTQPDPELLTLFDESGRNVQRTALLLRDLLADYPERAALARDILLCEQEGDRIVHDIHHRLAEHSNGHFDSADVHALAGALDDIVDYAEEAGDKLGLYNVEASMEQAQTMAELLVQCAEQVA